MVLKTLLLRLLDLTLDLDGKYVIIYAQIHSLKWVIIGQYLLPPASFLLLNQITAKIVGYATKNTVILGNINLITDSGMDRLTADGPAYSGLAAWAETYGMTDVWRWRHPQSRAFTCHSASHKTFSRTNIIFAGRPVLPRVTDIKILSRGISDYTSLLLSLDLSVSPSD